MRWAVKADNIVKGATMGDKKYFVETGGDPAKRSWSLGSGGDIYRNGAICSMMRVVQYLNDYEQELEQVKAHNRLLVEALGNLLAWVDNARGELADLDEDDLMILDGWRHDARKALTSDPADSKGGDDDLL